jgi:hypothetical protein
VNRTVFQRLGLGGTIAVPKPREVADLVLTACTGLLARMAMILAISNRSSISGFLALWCNQMTNAGLIEDDDHDP